MIVANWRSVFAGALLALSWLHPVVAQTIEQMAGQMIVVGFAGDSIDDPSVRALVDEIATGEIGGVMYLKPNVKNLAAVKAMNQAFRQANRSLPPFITIDQEGGLVERLTREVGFPETPSAAEVSSSMEPVDAGNLYREMARNLADLGFTVNFGPVADVNRNPANPIIAKFGRAYSDDAMKVFQYSAEFIAAHHDAGVITVLKHFPGHGSSTGDSHEGFVDISATWDPSELAPFTFLLQNKSPVGMVMVGHLYNDKSAEEGELPASLSPYWIGQVLRRDIGFDGVVITDDMEMGAVRQHYEFEDRIVRAVEAGVDVLLFSNTARPRSTIAGEIRSILVRHAEADPHFRARIEESYARIVRLKQRIGG